MNYGRRGQFLILFGAAAGIGIGALISSYRHSKQNEILTEKKMGNFKNNENNSPLLFPQCNELLPDDSNFCIYCGFKIR